MNRIITISMFVFAFISATCLAQPKLEITGDSGFSSETYDWKDSSPKNMPLKTDLTFKNVGKDTLQIVNVKPGCGCTISCLSKNTLAPNDTTKLHIELNAASSQGGVSKSITITTNEEKNMRYIFLKTNVIHPVQTEPSYFTFNQFKIGQTAKAVLKYKNNTNSPLLLKEVICSPSTLKCDLKAGTALAPNQEITITASAIAEKAGNFSGIVNIKTDKIDCDKSLQAYGVVEESPIFAPGTN